MQSTQRFTNRVSDYVKYRPSYPEDLIDCLRDTCKLSDSSVAADIGAGTGIFTRRLVPVVKQIYAVDPNQAMRRHLDAGTDVIVIDGSAEKTTLPDHSVDLITCAQAFHWFDALASKAEFARILKPGGWVALIWNERRTDENEFSREYEALMHRFNPDYHKTQDHGLAALQAFMDPHPVIQRTFDFRQELTREGLIGRSMSSSYAPARGTALETLFKGELSSLFERFADEGRVMMRYQTQLFLSQWS